MDFSMKAQILKGIIIFFLAVFFLLIIYLCYQYNAAIYKGPKSNHFDGKHFFNPYETEQAPRGLVSFYKWRVESTRTPWPEHRDNTLIPTVKERVYGDDLRVTFVGHATVLIQTDGLNILTDPIWSERASPVQWMGPKRVQSPGIDFNKLPPIDVVLISHNHYDQMDLPTLKKLEKKFHPLFVAGLGNDVLLKKTLKTANVTALDWWQSTTIKNNIALEFVPANHWSKRNFFDTNKMLWGGFLIHTQKGNIYFAGDTGFGTGKIFHEIADKGSIRLALIPIGAYEPRWFMKYSHVNPAESVKIFQILKPQYAMAIHFGTFQLTNEGIDEPVIALDKALKENQISQEQFEVLAVGEDWNVK